MRSVWSLPSRSRAWGSARAAAAAASALAVLAAVLVAVPPAVGIAASARWNAGPHPLEGLMVVLQSQPASCGPAVLATLTAWLGSPHTEAALIAAATMSGDGVTLSEFARLAHGVGLAGTWYSVPAAQLGSLPSPFVVHLNVDGAAGLGHLVAVAGVSHGYAVVADPAVGPYTLSLAALAAQYSGRAYVVGGRP